METLHIWKHARLLIFKTTLYPPLIGTCMIEQLVSLRKNFEWDCDLREGWGLSELLFCIDIESGDNS